MLAPDPPDVQWRVAFHNPAALVGDDLQIAVPWAQFERFRINLDPVARCRRLHDAGALVRRPVALCHNNVVTPAAPWFKSTWFQPHETAMDLQALAPGSGEGTRIEKQRHFIRVMSKSIEGHPLDRSERTLLEQLFAALMRGQDVSDLTGIRRPRAQRSTDPVHVALHYLCLTRLMDMHPELAWDMVGDAWGLTRREVQHVVAQNRGPAVAALPRFVDAPNRLLKICERHARGARPAHDDSAAPAPTQGSDDALVPMLARLMRPAAPSHETAS